MRAEELEAKFLTDDSGLGEGPLRLGVEELGQHRVGSDLQFFFKKNSKAHSDVRYMYAN